MPYIAGKLASAVACTLLVTGIFVYRTLAVGAHSPLSYILFGAAKKPEPVSAKVLASSSSSSDGTIKVDINTPDYTLTGTVDRDYAPVLEVFARNVLEGQEVGAGFCLYVKGRKVVDIAGGRRNDGKDYNLQSGAFLVGF
jgi:hypothetical protein